MPSSEREGDFTSADGEGLDAARRSEFNRRMVLTAVAAIAFAAARYWGPSIGDLLAMLGDGRQQFVKNVKFGAAVAAGMCGAVWWWIVPRRALPIFGGMLAGAMSAVFSYAGVFVSGCLVMGVLMGFLGTLASLLWTGIPALILLALVGGTLGLIEGLVRHTRESAVE